MGHWKIAGRVKILWKLKYGGQNSIFFSWNPWSKFYVPWKGGSKFYIFSQCLEKGGSKPRSLPTNFTEGVPPPGNWPIVLKQFHHTRIFPLQWRHNEHEGVLRHQHHDCLLNRLFRRRSTWSKKLSKLRVTGFVRGIHRWPVNSPHKGPVIRKMFPFDDVIMPCNLVIRSSPNLLPLTISLGLQYYNTVKPHV